MTVRDMIIRFHSRMDAGAKVFWNDIRAIALINEIVDDICQELVTTVPCKYTFKSVSGQQNYQVPSNYVVNELLFYNSSYNNEIVIDTTPRKIYKLYPDTTTEGYPTRGFIWHQSGRRELQIYPTFSEDDIEMDWWFFGWPEDLVGDKDEPAVPIEWHPSITKEMRNRQREEDGEITLSDLSILWAREVIKIKRMDCTKEILSNRGQYGTFEGNYPRISVGSSIDNQIVVASDDGTIW